LGKFVLRSVARAVFVIMVTSLGALVAVTELGDPFETIGPRMQDPRTRRNLNEIFGLDQPLVVRYVHFLSNLATGNLGVDLHYRRPIIDLLAEAAPNTLRLALAAVLIQVVFGLTLGILAAWSRHSFADVVITTAVVVLVSVPTLVLGVLLRDTLSGVKVFGWAAFPLLPRTIGVQTSWLRNMILPATVLGVHALAFIVIMARGSMLEVLNADYIRTARAKGLTERKVVFKHAARNALIPVTELMGMQLGALLGGTVVVETIFQYPGLGYLFLRSMNDNNHPVMIVVAVYSVVLFVVVLMIVDIVTAWLDPRIRALD
jgi:ABC-type dipeptide/oligopeptide/nickel transport system permease component